MPLNRRVAHAADDAALVGNAPHQMTRSRDAPTPGISKPRARENTRSPGFRADGLRPRGDGALTGAARLETSLRLPWGVVARLPLASLLTMHL